MTPLAGGPPWQVWWSFNRDAYLDLAGRISGLGVRSGGPRALFPTPEEIEGEVLPALDELLSEGGYTPLVGAALVAMERIEDDLRGDPPGRSIGSIVRHYVPTEIVSIARHYVPTGAVEAREASLVALGVRGAPDSVDLLEDLLVDSAEGQALRGGPVEPRTRVFAAYALGLLAGVREDAELRARIGGALWRVLVEDDRAPHELHLACLLAIGLAPAFECPGGVHVAGEVCRGFQIGSLLHYFRDEERDPELRAHAVATLGKLCQDLAASFAEEVVPLLSAALSRRAKQHPAVVAGAVLGLSHAVDADRDEHDRAARRALKKLSRRDEGLAGRFASVALAYVGARAIEGEEQVLNEIRSFLHTGLLRGKRGLDGWSALALGVLEFRRAAALRIPADEDVVAWLCSAAGERGRAERSTAACLALGLLRDAGAAEALLRGLERAEDPARAGFAALALGLAGARDAAQELRRTLAGADEPALVYGAALGLRLLGDREAAPLLLERLDELAGRRAAAAAAGEEARTEALVAGEVLLVEALGLLGDRNTLSALVARLRDGATPDEVRVACVSALGAMCDEDALSWGAPLAADLHYGALAVTLVDPFGDGTGILDMR